MYKQQEFNNTWLNLFFNIVFSIFFISAYVITVKHFSDAIGMYVFTGLGLIFTLFSSLNIFELLKSYAEDGFGNDEACNLEFKIDVYSKLNYMCLFSLMLCVFFAK